MELTDAARRIVGQHLPVIAVLVVAGAIIGGLLSSGGHQYSASARLAVGAEDPKTQPESAAIADAAKAIATSPSAVRAALADARATGRDPNKVASDHVSVQALGSSNIVELNVTDRDPRVAAGIANALAARVVSTRAKVADGSFRQVMSQLDQQLGVVSRKISALSPLDNSGARDLLTQRRSILTSEQVSLLSARAVGPKPAVISAATTPTHAESTPFVPDLILGALLGLIVGVSVAALIETFRPSVVGDEAVAREMGVPLIGRLTSDPSDPQSPEVTDVIASRLKLAAKARHVANVGLVGTRGSMDLGTLAGSLGPVEAADAHGTPALNGKPTGLVLVAPSTVQRSELAAASDLLRISPAPLLGVITYPTNRRQQGQREAAAVEA